LLSVIHHCTCALCTECAFVILDLRNKRWERDCLFPILFVIMLIDNVENVCVGFIMNAFFICWSSRIRIRWCYFSRICLSLVLCVFIFSFAEEAFSFDVDPCVIICHTGTCRFLLKQIKKTRYHMGYFLFVLLEHKIIHRASHLWEC